MKTQDVAEFFGSKKKLADSLGISPSAVTMWGEFVPASRQFQIQILSCGKFKAESTEPPAATEQVNPNQEEQPKPEGFVERRRPGAQSTKGIRTGRRSTDATVREQIIALNATRRGKRPDSFE
jgi:hypothetical protein